MLRCGGAGGAGLNASPATPPVGRGGAVAGAAPAGTQTPTGEAPKELPAQAGAAGSLTSPDVMKEMEELDRQLEEASKQAARAGGGEKT